MSSSLATFAAGKRRAVLAIGAAAAASGAMAAMAAPAQAAFTTAQCQGSPVAGRGASFPQELHNAGYWGAGFNSSNWCGGVAGAPPAPTYNTATPSVAGATISGSGAGLGACGAGQSGYPTGIRDTAVRFCATDDPPTTVQQARINEGDPSTTADNGKIHLLPVAGGANAMLMHYPEGCGMPTAVGSTTDGTAGDTAAEQTQRPLVPNSRLELAFRGASNMDTWAELVPGISGTATGAAFGGDNRNAGKSCTGTTPATGIPIYRIVRNDSSGTTFNWKSFLGLVQGGLGSDQWLGAASLSPGNNRWPSQGSFGTVVQADAGTHKPASTGANAFICQDTVDYLCGGATSGNGGLVKVATYTDGSIGYSDLGTARKTSGEAAWEKRARDFETTKTTAGNPRDYTFWVPIENKPDKATDNTVAKTYIEPTKDATNHLNTGTAVVGNRGANCTSLPALRNVPTPANSPDGDPTLGDWSQTIATGGDQYASCVLTYLMVWDDNAPIYGNTPEEEKKARTVKDYVSFIASPLGQNLGPQPDFFPAGTDFSPTPNGLQNILSNGVQAIGWNKNPGTGGGGTPPSGGGGTPPPPSGGGGTPPPPSGGGGTVPPPSITPSNRFRRAGLKVSRQAVTVTLTFPAAGRLTVTGTSKVGKRSISSTKLSAGVRQGQTKVTLKLSTRAKRVLKKTGKLKVNLKFVFRPTGGTASSQKASVNFKQKKAAKPKKKAAKRK